MAPEMFKCEGYNFSYDVYSFAILLWEICTLKKPFEKYREFKDLERKVVDEGKRPSLKSFSSYALKDLLTRCWDPDHSQRPTFESIAEVVKDEIVNFKENPALGSVSSLAILSRRNSMQEGRLEAGAGRPAQRGRAPRRGSTSFVPTRRSDGRIYERSSSSSQGRVGIDSKTTGEKGQRRQPKLSRTQSGLNF
jgi:serine/threonine protein kinase